MSRRQIDALATAVMMAGTALFLCGAGAALYAAFDGTPRATVGCLAVALVGGGIAWAAAWAGEGFK